MAVWLGFFPYLKRLAKVPDPENRKLPLPLIRGGCAKNEQHQEKAPRAILHFIINYQERPAQQHGDSSFVH